MVLPVAMPSRSAGLRRMAPAISFAVCRLTSSALRFNTASIPLSSQFRAFERFNAPAKIGALAFAASAEAANHQIVPVRAIEPEHVQDGLDFGRIEHQRHAQQRVPRRYIQKVRRALVRRSRDNSFAGVPELRYV